MLPSRAPEQYLTFTLGQSLYAVQIAPIREIIEYPGLTEIPMTPAFLRGVINLRGAVVPVIDLAVRFGRGQTGVGRRTCIVITEIGGDKGPLPLGILVDGVNEVLEVSAEQVEDKPDFGLGLRPEFVRGMIRQQNRFIVMLDIGHVLSVAELEQLVEVETGAAAAAVTVG
ncbi:chemotaxis protein CheW [Vogesella sp. LIG4]|uniref:chemotaxis protein CheW n=1 Tax=Vogesella sp. LIG4 TaxID=1192162 RepID=UPI00081FC6D1|nr:chemotaxis protein CheW [Vogesella sp. LIG4]SCK29376.1 purine-binding chemotaxis protein CheW [Vogesella sp. LIG4]